MAKNEHKLCGSLEIDLHTCKDEITAIKILEYELKALKAAFRCKIYEYYKKIKKEKS